MYRCLLEAPAADPRVAKRIRANLDRDGRVEQVEIVAGSRRNPYGGTVRIPIRYVRVVDRVQGRLLKRRISAMVEFARVKVRDFNRDGRLDIWFAGVSGNGGTAPHWFGLFDWTGRRRRVLWRWSWRRSVVGSRWAGASVHRPEYASEYPGLELVLKEGVLSSGDATVVRAGSWSRYTRIAQTRIAIASTTATTRPRTASTPPRVCSTDRAQLSETECS